MAKKTPSKTPRKPVEKTAAEAAKKTAQTARKATEETTESVESLRRTIASKTSNVPPIPFMNMETFDMNNQNKNYDKMMQDAASSTQQQFEAMSQSASVYAKGMEDYFKTWMTLAQQSSDKMANSAKDLLACRTVNEFAEAQTKLAQSNFEDFVSNATKLSELSIKVAIDSIAPLNDQVGKTMQKATNKAAA